MPFRLILGLFFLATAAHAREDKYADLCARLLQSSKAESKVVFPDRRSAQDVLLALDAATRDFHSAHPGYKTKSALERDDEVRLTPEGTIGLLDHINEMLRFSRDLKNAEYFAPEHTEFQVRKGWPVEEEYWLSSASPRDLKNYKDVKLYSTLFPSPEFAELRGRAASFKSLLQREVEFLRYHPSVVAYVPLSIFSGMWRDAAAQLPKFQVRALEDGALDKAKASLAQTIAPRERELFSPEALEPLLRNLKNRVDFAIGAETKWTFSVRTIKTAPFPGRTELIVKIDSPDVAVAWRASLEFMDLYAQALRRRVPTLSIPPVDATPVEFLPVLQKNLYPSHK